MREPEPVQDSFAEVAQSPTSGASAKNNNWLRWIALPFAAFGGGAISAFAISMLLWGTHWMRGATLDSPCFLYVIPCLQHALFGGSYVAISLKVAPRGKAVAAIVMTTILGVLCVAMFAFIFLSRESTGTKVFDAIQILIMLVTAIVTVSSLPNEPGWADT